mgnify:CR=1 FL=1
MGNPTTIAASLSTNTLGLVRPDLPVRPVAQRMKHPVREARNDDYGRHLAQATLLNWLGQSPITFHRIYVDITGSVVSGLWLSYALNMASRADPKEFDGNDFVFGMSARDCEIATGITRGQQASCRRALAELGLLSETGGQRRAPTYRLHMDQVADRLMYESRTLADALSTCATPHACICG